MPDIVLHRTRRGVLAHFASDPCIGPSLEHYGEWAEAEIHMLRAYLRPGATAVDVGANVGAHTLAFAEMVGPQGRVIAVEGQPEVFELLAHNVVANGLTGRVRCVGALAGRRLALAPYALGELHPNTGARSFQDEVARSTAGAKTGDLELHLPVLPLDSLRLEACDLLKIDVEGMEPDVISGALELIGTYRPVIYFENNLGQEANLASVADLVRPLGYRLYCHYSNPFNSQNFKGGSDNIFGGSVERNILAIPPGGLAPPLPEITADPPPPPPLEETIGGVALTG